MNEPVIRFDDETMLTEAIKTEPALRASILDRINSHGVLRMPPNDGLTKGEYEALAGFVKQVR